MMSDASSPSLAVAAIVAPLSTEVGKPSGRFRTQRDRVLSDTFDDDGGDTKREDGFVVSGDQ